MTSLLPRLGAEAQRQIREQLTPKEIAADKPSKYRAKKCESWGIKFDSQRERDHFGELRMLERAGKIAQLEAHPSWSLDLNGVHIGHYSADAAYCEVRGECLGPQIIVDIKSKPTMTAASKLRIRLFEAIYQVKVRIIE